MNLGQLIDPHWVQERFPERSTWHGAREAAPFVVERRGRRSPKYYAVLEVLQALAQPLLTAQVAARLVGVTNTQVSAHLGYALARGHAKREGVDRRHLYYEITPAGAEYLQKHPPR